MSITLETLYNEICNDYEVTLLTDSCFEKNINWMHMVEIAEFAYLLHGGELVFNSGVNFTSIEWLKSFINELVKEEAGGLVIAAKDISIFTDDIIAYCNKIHFPLFYASWKTSFLEIMRKFSEILLSTDQNSAVLVTALKNAIYFPSDYQTYIPHFERNNFFSNSSYTITIIKPTSNAVSEKPGILDNFKKSFRFIIKESIIFEEMDRLIILTVNHHPTYLKKTFETLSISTSNLHIGIGSHETGLKNIHLSYKNALTAFKLNKQLNSHKPTIYEKLGVYQLLANMKEPEICFNFVNNILGPLIEFDAANSTNHLDVLECFFENECNLIQTADALFFHKNTLKYKINKIQEILNCDIRSNENRLRIMLALHIYRLGKDFFIKTT